MLRFVSDENFNNVIVRGLRRRLPTIDLVRVQDVSLLHADDPTILAWAGDEGRIVLTHDVTTITAHALDRIDQGLAVAGVIQVRLGLSIGEVIGDLCLLAVCGERQDFDDTIMYLPIS